MYSPPQKKIKEIGHIHTQTNLLDEKSGLPWGRAFITLALLSFSERPFLGDDLWGHERVNTACLPSWKCSEAWLIGVDEVAWWGD